MRDLQAFIAAGIAWLIDFRNGASMDEFYEWYVVIKYTDENYLGESADAFYVKNSVEAMVQVSGGPMRPGEKLRGYWATTARQRKFAIQLSESRRKADRKWQLYTQHLEDMFARQEEKKIDIG